MRIVGISGSPVKEGNLDTFLTHIMTLAQEKGIDTETIHLAKYDIQHCTHCNFCLAKQKPGRYCAIDDDAQILFEKLETADIIVFASPVYFMRTSGRMATFIDRMRVFIFGKEAGGKLRNKIGMSAAVAWLRHGGMETTHLSHIQAFVTLDMIPATIHSCISPLGASALASRHGAGVFDPAVRVGIKEDDDGLKSARALLDRAVELAELIHPSDRAMTVTGEI
jgi:multimeric flavodoxin WrbA